MVGGTRRFIFMESFSQLFRCSGERNDAIPCEVTRLYRASFCLGEYRGPVSFIVWGSGSALYLFNTATPPEHFLPIDGSR